MTLTCNLCGVGYGGGGVVSGERGHAALLLDNWVEVWVVHGLASCQPFLMIIAQQLVQKVQSLRTDQMLIFTVDEALPSFT